MLGKRKEGSEVMEVEGGEERREYISGQNKMEVIR